MKHISTICAIATPPGTGAISIIRLSGPKSFSIASRLFRSSKNKEIIKKPNRVHFGYIFYKNQTIDEVLITFFKGPNSYTGEDVVEISCHGSHFIQQQIMEILIECGARVAEPGEFTLRAFLNSKMDLSQAESVADLINSRNKAFHDAAINQMRGGFSNEIKILRSKLLEFVSLIELELDFSEEDVEFADRKSLLIQVKTIHKIIKQLIDSFKYGNVIKNGISVAIVGKPNAGKSTLLNTLLNEEKAIVSEIPGTTRDVIEDTINIKGILFRFIDTAGIRRPEDKLESLGIERTYENIKKASIIMLIIDPGDNPNNIEKQINSLDLSKEQKLVILINKIDLFDKKLLDTNYKTLISTLNYPIILISAKKKINVEEIINYLVTMTKYNHQLYNDIIITNVRHFDSLKNTYVAGERVIAGLQNNISKDLLSQDVREMIHHLGSITGEITTEEVLGNIFKNFCIGK